MATGHRMLGQIDNSRHQLSLGFTVRLLPRALMTLLIGSGAMSVLAEDAVQSVDEASSDGVMDRTSELRTTPPQLALARVFESGADVSSYLVSEKLDGVRAYWDGQRLISRGGLLIQAPAWFTAGFPDQPLDGELWMGRGRFALVSGAVRRHEPEPEAWQQIRYMVFDLPAADGGFAERAAELSELVQATGNPHLAAIDQREAADEAALMAMLDQTLAVGGEGLMLHRRDATHASGRVNHLLKLKPHLDAEALVLGHVPGNGKYEGMLGALRVRTEDGREFRIGTGFSDAERADPPPLGSRVTYRYRGLTKTGLPRFASFLRLADAP